MIHRNDHLVVSTIDVVKKCVGGKWSMDIQSFGFHRSYNGFNEFNTLRRYLARHGGIPKKPLIASMPISLRVAGNTDYTTQATLSLVNLNTQIADPVRRLRAIRDAAGAVKALARRARGVIPTDFPSIGVPWVLHGLATLYGRSGITRAVPPLANVVISNVPGPPVPLYAAGARMATYWPVSIVEHGVGLNLTVMSYADAMGFGFTTARCAVPDARELSAALEAALQELLSATRAAARRTPAGATTSTRRTPEPTGTRRTRKPVSTRRTPKPASTRRTLAPATG